jgi:tetratricopeptide (TPR) repeat protein
MKFPQNPRTILLHILTVALFVSFISLPISAQTGDLDSIKKEAVRLLNEDKFIEAVPFLEKIVKAEPNNAEMYFYLGISYLAQSNAIRDKDAVRQTRIKARNAFIKSKSLGSTEKLLDPFIASLPEDGSVQRKFSKILEAEELMLQGETVFAQGDYDEALKLYGDALKLDPTIYEAALFSGDMYLRKNDFPNAEIWYQKTIKIDPNRETAYRYSATPLMKQKKYDEARERYIEAFIVEPYSRLSAVGLGQWAQATGASLGHPKIEIPTSVSSDEKGNTQINLGALLGENKDDDSGAAWMLYGITRATWRNEEFAKKYPNQKYRHSLAEELDALQSVLSFANDTKDKKKKKVILSPALLKLKELNDKGLLAAYILMARPDEGIVQDHADYLKENREKLRQYVREYVIQK